MREERVLRNFPMSGKVGGGRLSKNGHLEGILRYTERHWELEISLQESTCKLHFTTSKGTTNDGKQTNCNQYKYFLYRGSMQFTTF